MLQEWINDNKYNKVSFCHKVGISRPTLDRLLTGDANKLQYVTAVKIKQFTGLNPWDYVDGLDSIKNLTARSSQ